MLLILLALTTAFVESPIAAFAFRKRDSRLYVLLISALVNLLTNLLLNGLCLPLLARTPLSALWDSWLSLLLGELVLAYAGEGILYRILVRGVSLGRGLLVSLAGNTVSFGLGLGLWAILGRPSGEAMIPGFAVLCGAAGIFWFICLARGIIHEKGE
ncbi:MAG: hypothetical protein IKX47_02045 [Oscillospiraceae bacterium]|nr:hypothetical protein [Oscillospiraceae bacterium]